jgi:hypothetical protein
MWQLLAPASLPGESMEPTYADDQPQGLIQKYVKF